LIDEEAVRISRSPINWFRSFSLARLLDSWRMALDSLKANKMRTILTLLGIIIGVMTVVGMLSIIEGLNQSMATRIGEMGSNLFVISKYPAVRFGPHQDPGIRNRKDLTIDDAYALAEECPSILAISPECWAHAKVKYKGHETSEACSIGGAGADYLLVNNNELSGGRALTDEDILSARHVCVLANEPAEALFGYEDPLGKEVRIKGQRFLVVGVIEPKGQFLGNSQDNYVLIPHSTFEKLFSKDEYYLHFFIQAISKEELPAAIDQSERLLRLRRGVAADEENDFEIYTQDTLMDLYNQITGAAYAIMVGVAAISLLVGGIGIMNIMLVAVIERTREIGVRKAVGARRRDILRQFITESAGLSIVGGTIGIIVGVLVALGVASATGLPRTVPLWSVGLGFSFSVGIGLFFGIYPAYKASKLDPIEALHYE